MTTATVHQPAGFVAALADIPRARRRLYAAGFVLDLLIMFVVLSTVWGL